MFIEIMQDNLCLLNKIIYVLNFFKLFIIEEELGIVKIFSSLIKYVAFEQKAKFRNQRYSHNSWKGTGKNKQNLWSWLWTAIK